MSDVAAQPRPTLLREVEPIVLPHAIMDEREVLPFIVEEPLVPACEHLFDKNIRTVLSSANVRDIAAGFAYITLDCFTMSAENRAVVEDLGLDTSVVPFHDGSELLVALLKFDVAADTRIRHLSRQALHAANNFLLQPKLW